MVPVGLPEATDEIGLFCPKWTGCILGNISQQYGRGASVPRRTYRRRGEPAMRISEDRYERDRQRLELALRFLTHEARTQTIRVWTGLSDDRIRKLYRSYLGRAACYVPRHRGKSPHQAAYFTRSLRIQQEAAVLASFFALAGLVPAEPSAAAGTALPDIARGNSLCTAFESYATMIPTASISFEHA